MTDIASPESALSVDQAVERLLAKPAETVAAPEVAEAVVPAETPSEAEPTAEETSSEPLEANATDEDAEQPEAEAPPIEPPHWWAADKKARFAEIDPELQSVILEQEKNRERTVTKAQQTAADAAKQAEDARKTADAKVIETTQLLERVNSVLPQAEQALKSKWEQVDWVKWAEIDPSAYTLGKAQFDAETAQLQQLKAAKQDAEKIVETERAEADKAKQTQWAQGEAAKLATLVPDLADPQKAPELSKKIIAYAKSLGYSDAQINNAGALEWKMAHQAMLAAEATTALTTPKPKAVPVAAKPAVKPASGQTPAKTTTADAAKARLAKSGGTDDAVALLLARSQKG